MCSTCIINIGDRLYISPEVLSFIIIMLVDNLHVYRPVYLPQVYIRKGRLLLALSAVKRAAGVAAGGASHPDVHTMLVR